MNYKGIKCKIENNFDKLIYIYNLIHQFINLGKSREFQTNRCPKEIRAEIKYKKAQSRSTVRAERTVLPAAGTLLGAQAGCLLHECMFICIKE